MIKKIPTTVLEGDLTYCYYVCDINGKQHTIYPTVVIKDKEYIPLYRSLTDAAEAALLSADCTGSQSVELKYSDLVGQYRLMGYSEALKLTGKEHASYNSLVSKTDLVNDTHSLLK